METSIDPVRSALDGLTGPGGAFEIAIEDVRGVGMQVFTTRMHAFREVFATAYNRPDEFEGWSNLHRFDELVAEPSRDIPDTPIDEDDVAVIFYTSATTGRPKGVTTTHRAWIASMQAVVAYLFAAAMSDPSAAAMAS